MLVKQNQDTFIRKFGSLGYITNQLTKKDRVYDEVGSIFLASLSRTAKSVDAIINEIFSQFADVTLDQLKPDVIDFLEELHKEGFIIAGNSTEEIEEQDTGFTYNVDNPKTIAMRILNQDFDSSMKPSDELMTDYFREHPTIFGGHFEVTSRCNEKCIHCYQPRHNPRHIEMALVKDIIAQLHDMGTVSMTFSGGEPFLHPEFLDILQLARKNDFMINILSNGTLIDAEAIRVMKETNINMIQISVYSMDAKTHDSITRFSGSLEKTIKNVRLLIANDIPVQISCPIMMKNWDSYRDVARWCYSRNVRVMSDFVLMAKSNFDISNLENRLDLSKTKKVIQDIIEIDGEYQLLLNTEPKTKDLDHYANQPVCGVAIDNVCFTADGSMYPCSGFQGYLLGNVKEHTIREIWENSEKVLFLRSILNKSFPKCLSCEARDYCIMCLVRNYNESNGDMFKVADHFCDVAFINKELVETFRKQQDGK